VLSFIKKNRKILNTKRVEGKKDHEINDNFCNAGQVTMNFYIPQIRRHESKFFWQHFFIFFYADIKYII